MSENQPQQQTEATEEWAIVELMGHSKIAGQIQQSNYPEMLRVDVYEPDGKGIAYTRHVNFKSIYAINPVEKLVALAMGTRLETPPASAYTLRRLIGQAQPEPDEDQYQHELDY